MAGLSLNLFVRTDEDFEIAQYRILSGLKEMWEAFTSNFIYPHLNSLIELHASLRSIRENLDQLRSAGPRHIAGLDLIERALVYESEPMSNREIAYVEDLIEWALPLVREAIEEGRTIFEFVDEHLRLEEVGIIPSYVQEGYFIVPDRVHARLHILRYNLSIFAKADERYRTLRTATVKTIEDWSVVQTPTSVKLGLMQEKRDLPNPATFMVETTLDFPFEDTVLPVAKRKLLRHLSSMEGIS